MKIRLAAGAAVLSLGLCLGASVATPASAHSLTRGKPYGCQINSQVCATPGANQLPAPSQLPPTGGGAHGTGFSGDVAWTAAGLALALAGLGVRRAARR